MAQDSIDRAGIYIGDKLDALKQVLGDSNGKMRDRLDQVSGQLREKAGSAAVRLARDSKSSWQSVRRQAAENPGPALAIATAAGFVLGFLLRGRDA